MPKVFWNGAMLAQSNLCRMIDGKYYFPPESIRFEFLKASDTTNYFDIEVDGAVNPNAAWRIEESRERNCSFPFYITFGDRVSIVD